MLIANKATCFYVTEKAKRFYASPYFVIQNQFSYSGALLRKAVDITSIFVDITSIYSTYIKLELFICFVMSCLLFSSSLWKIFMRNLWKVRTNVSHDHPVVAL